MDQCCTWHIAIQGFLSSFATLWHRFSNNFHFHFHHQRTRCGASWSNATISVDAADFLTFHWRCPRRRSSAASVAAAAAAVISPVALCAVPVDGTVDNDCVSLNRPPTRLAINLDDDLLSSSFSSFFSDYYLMCYFSHYYSYDLHRARRVNWIREGDEVDEDMTYRSNQEWDRLKLSMQFLWTLFFFTLLLLSIQKVEVEMDMSYRSKQEWELVIDINYRCIFSCHFFSSLLFRLSIQTDKEMNVGHARTLHFY